MTIFDCCREYKAAPVQNTRGLRDNDDDYVPVDPKYLHSDTNFIQINGCPPNKFVPAYSFIAKGFFDVLLESETNNGTILIPDFNQKLTTYRPNGEGSLCLEISEPLLLYGPDPDEEKMPRKVIALAEKLQNQFNTLESEKEQLEARAK